MSDQFRKASEPPPVHEAAQLFPTGATNADYIRNLSRHMRNAGSHDPSRQPIVLTPDGQLLEGRGRWAACQVPPRQLPITRIERSTNPWLYILSRHTAELMALDVPKRSMIVGRVPARGMVGSPNEVNLDDPPNRRVLAEISGLSTTSVQRAQTIYQYGIPELVELCIDGSVTPSMGMAIARHDKAIQLEFSKRVSHGEHPRTVRIRMGLTGEQEEQEPEKPLVRNHSSKHRYVKEHTIQQVVGMFSAVNLILDAAEGLDPSITPEEARTWLVDLGRTHTAYRRITELLKQRKDSE
jgi:hypothetical protein